jgi:Hint domain-containing protein
MIRPALTIAMLVAIVAAGCAGSGAATSPSPTSGAPLTTAELRYRLIDTLGPLWFCDPDFYPITVQDEAKRSVERFGEIQSDREAFAAILAHLGIPAGADFTADQKLAIYRAWKQLNAIFLEPGNNGANRFDYRNMPAPGASEGRRTTGTIDQAGTITIEQQAPAGEPPCPICLARGTRIATPQGEVAVEDVQVGVRVWSIDGAGRRVVATVVLMGQTPVPATHQVVRLALDDGRVLRASPGHPLADGRLLATIRASDTVDGATVLRANLEAYAGGWTFDLLTDSPSGGYIADGIPLGSTLAGG